MKIYIFDIFLVHICNEKHIPRMTKSIITYFHNLLEAISFLDKNTKI